MRPVISAFAAVAVVAAAITATPAAAPAAWGWKTFQLGVQQDATHPAGISDLAAVSASDIWGVGGWKTPFTGQGEPLIEHWTGRHWDFVPSPRPPQGVATTSSTASPHA